MREHSLYIDSGILIIFSLLLWLALSTGLVLVCLLEAVDDFVYLRDVFLLEDNSVADTILLRDFLRGRYDLIRPMGSSSPAPFSLDAARDPVARSIRGCAQTSGMLL